MSSASLTPEQRAELDSLREELRSAELRAAEALHGLGPDHILEGAALTQFEEADHEISELRGRIRELEGDK